MWKRKALPCWPRKFCSLGVSWGRERERGGGGEGLGEQERGRREAYAADDVVVVGEMGLAVPAAVDLATGEVGVVGESHGCGWVVD